jgi:hypothetical protein
VWKLDRWILGGPAPVRLKIWSDLDVSESQIVGAGWVAHHLFPEVSLAAGTQVFRQGGMDLAVASIVGDSHTTSKSWL